MANRIQIFMGDLFAEPCDLVVLPSSRSGSITGWVRHRIARHGIPEPRPGKELGDTEVVPAASPGGLAPLACWATSVQQNSSTASAIRRIGAQLAYHGVSHPAVRVIAVPLLGAGAGGLTEIESAEALVEGFAAGVPTEAVLRVHVLAENLVERLEAKFKPLLASPARASVFISYGGPDEDFATKLNRALKERGVDTWFFPDDAVPGQKLHRTMHEGVNTHDRVLLICSRHSLMRPGVSNELERVLEREAREGGKDILLPVRVDDHVLSQWSPDRSDIATQVRSRVIADFSEAMQDDAKFEAAVERVVRALIL